MFLFFPRIPYIPYAVLECTSSGKGCPLAFQRVLNDSCEPERWYIQRTDELYKYSVCVASIIFITCLFYLTSHN